MYIPFVSLCRSRDAQLIYWRRSHTEGSDEFVPCDAHVDPYTEMAAQDRGFCYPLNEGSGSVANDIVNNRQGTYAGEYGWAAGPVVPWTADGKGSGWTNPDTFISQAAAAPNNTGGYVLGAPFQPLNTNPAKITDFPFSLACWFKMPNGETSFNSGGGAEDTTITLLQIMHYDSDLSTTAKFNARIDLRRVRNATAISFGDRPGIYLSAVIEPSAGVEHTCTSDPTNNPYAASIADVGGFPTGWDGGWHYVVATFSSNEISLFIDGVLVKAQSHASVSMPETPRFRVSINHDQESASAERGRDIQICYASGYKSKLKTPQVLRHFLAVRRTMDLKINHTIGNKYSTAQLDHVGGLSITGDLDYSPSSRRAEYRHDSRWVHPIRLNDPALSNLNDEGPKDDEAQFAILRHFELEPAAAGQDRKDAWWNWRCPLITTAGGFQWADGREDDIPGLGLTFLCGWEGQGKSRVGTTDDGSPAPEWTFLMNFIGAGTATTGTSWTVETGTHVGFGVLSKGTSPAGKDGFAIARVGTSTNSYFEFYAPWESVNSPTDTEVMVVGNDSTFFAAREWEYQVIGCKADSTSLLMRLGHRANKRALDTERAIVKADYLKPSGSNYIDADPVDVTDCPRSQRPADLDFLYCNRFKDTTNDHAYEISGSTAVEDRNRYGPMIAMPAISDGDMRRIMRLMNGQPLMRSRPALRGVSRHLALNAPTRVLT